MCRYVYKHVFVCVHIHLCNYVLFLVYYGHYHLGDIFMIECLGNRNKCFMSSVLSMEL